MNHKARTYQILLVVGFLAIICAVPLVQVGLEVYRGTPVQATDMFRHPPTVKNLRRFEQSLEDNWWGQEQIRPQMQRFFLQSIGDTGIKAIEGLDRWMFYRPGVQYLYSKDRLEADDPNSTWVPTTTAQTRRQNAADAIVRFRDQLKERGIELLVMPVPGKPSVYPDKLTRRANGRQHEFHSPTEELLKMLEQRGVQTVDLFTTFRASRQATSGPASESALYLARDTHWTPAGASLAAEAVARKLKQLDWIPEHPYKYTKKTVPVRRWGDIVEMTRIPGARESYAEEEVECRQVLDPFHGGPLVPPPGEREGTYMNKHLLDTPMEARFLLLGDSFSRIYQFAEPASLGELVETEAESDEEQGEGNQPTKAEKSNKKRLLPGSAGFPSLLANALNAPVDYIVSDGGAATDVRQKLSVNAEILDNKKVVIWEFTERDIPLGKQGWRDVPLPPE